jgi:hypothetical protein
VMLDANNRVRYRVSHFGKCRRGTIFRALFTWLNFIVRQEVVEGGY